MNAPFRDQTKPPSDTITYFDYGAAVARSKRPLPWKLLFAAGGVSAITTFGWLFQEARLDGRGGLDGLGYALLMGILAFFWPFVVIPFLRAQSTLSGENLVTRPIPQTRQPGTPGKPC